jgi:hypothetical protein
MAKTLDSGCRPHSEDLSERVLPHLHPLPVLAPRRALSHG